MQGWDAVAQQAAAAITLNGSYANFTMCADEGSRRLGYHKATSSEKRTVHQSSLCEQDKIRCAPLLLITIAASLQQQQSEPDAHNEARCTILQDKECRHSGAEASDDCVMAVQKNWEPLKVCCCARGLPLQDPSILDCLERYLLHLLLLPLPVRLGIKCQGSLLPSTTPALYQVPP